jgi:hypothetical protein
MMPPLDGMYSRQTVGGTVKHQVHQEHQGVPVNAFLRQLPKDVANTGCASADGLKAQDGNTHFDTKAQLELGKRYATGMLSLLKK